MEVGATGTPSGVLFSGIAIIRIHDGIRRSRIVVADFCSPGKGGARGGVCSEAGFGVDVSGGLAWSDPRRGLSAEVRGRGLISHAADGFRERGLSGSLSWDPTPETARGPSLSLRQTVGAPAAGGVDALLERGTLAGLAANDSVESAFARRIVCSATWAVSRKVANGCVGSAETASADGTDAPA